MKVVAVVVTYNRLTLLKRTIGCLRANAPVSAIVVVNNGSTDGTAGWLREQSDLTVIHQDNVGGSGGFHTGMRHACGMGADWVWCMDDDVFPRPNCLEQLLLHRNDLPHTGILAPRRLLGGQVYTNDFFGFNFTNPFSSMRKGRLAKVRVAGPVEIQGTAFEGMLVSAPLIAAISYPLKDLFIFCDDTEYCYRAVRAGYRICYVPSALMDKEQFFSSDTWSERNRKKKWKRFYQLRNSTYVNHHYGRNAAVRYLRGFFGLTGYIAIALFTIPFCRAYRWSDIPRFVRAYSDGIHERLGIMHS